MDFRKARETDDLPAAASPAASDDSGLIPIDFAHLVEALERAQRQSAAAVAEGAAASIKHSGISDNALKGLEAMTPRSAELPQLHCPANFHDRVAEIVRAATKAQEINPAVTENSLE